MMTKELQEEDIISVWPSDKDLEFFADSIAKKTVESILDKFYQDITKEVSSVSVKMKHLKKQVQSDIDALYSHLQDFKQQTTINEEFVRLIDLCI